VVENSVSLGCDARVTTSKSAAGVSNERNSFTCKGLTSRLLTMQAKCSFALLGTYGQDKQHHIPEEQNSYIDLPVWTERKY
jgi:hypothetical protein